MRQAWLRERAQWEMQISCIQSPKRTGSLHTRERKNRPQIICVVSKWQDVRMEQNKTRKKTATGKGRLLLSCGEIFHLADQVHDERHVSKDMICRKEEGLLGRKVESGNTQVL